MTYTHKSPSEPASMMTREILKESSELRKQGKKALVLGNQKYTDFMNDIPSFIRFVRSELDGIEHLSVAGFVVTKEDQAHKLPYQSELIVYQRRKQ